jgi:hypothetical protein
MERGPKALVDLAADRGYSPVGEYVSKCHLCWDVRQSIYKDYPDLFAPEELYRD